MNKVNNLPLPLPPALSEIQSVLHSLLLVAPGALLLSWEQPRKANVAIYSCIR